MNNIALSRSQQVNGNGFRSPFYMIGGDMTLQDFWYGIAGNFIRDGFIKAGGRLQIDYDVAVNLMSEELYIISETCRKKDWKSVSNYGKGYKELYKRHQDLDYTIEDENIWIDEVWDKVIEELPIIHSYLCNPSISWLPRINEMYNIPINTILGLLWSFAHIPTEEERLKENQEDNFEYENLDY